jgi:hypothetical protein
MRARAAVLSLIVLAVRHVRCATHGELVDAPQMARSVHAGSWLVAVDSDGGDDHCALADGVRHDASVPTATAPAAAAHAAVRVTTPPIVTRVVAIDFRLAPKTSPPDRTT